MDGDFYVAASLATTLTKVALRYVTIVQDRKRQNVKYRTSSETVVEQFVI